MTFRHVDGPQFVPPSSGEGHVSYCYFLTLTSDAAVDVGVQAFAVPRGVDRGVHSPPETAALCPLCPPQQLRRLCSFPPAVHEEVRLLHILLPRVIFLGFF